MTGQVQAIFWAQWRSMMNMYPRASTGGVVFSVATMVLWYGGVLFAAILTAKVTAIARVDALARFLPIGLLVALLYWQIVPVMMASMGASIDFRRLLVYPVPFGQLFGIEVLLRLTTGIEVLLITAGAAVGLWLNPAVPWWGPLVFLPFTLFNMMLSAGVRDLLRRLFARKRIRELMILGLVMLAAIPQVLVVTGVPRPLRRFFSDFSFGYWPWTVTGRIATGEVAAAGVLALAAWLLLAYAFGRWQFHKGLKFDEEAAQATPVPSPTAARWTERLFTIPSALFPDPLGVLIEKEVRFLCRAPRFRLVFLMGFSFGLLVWMPLAFGRSHTPDSFMSQNFLTMVSVYALMLLGEVCFWNTFGFDRSAAQVYFLMPIRFSTVLVGKNITSAAFVMLELLAVIGVCLALRLPIPTAKIGEALLVTVILMIYLLAVGNLASTHYPRAVDPAQSWRSSGAGKFQAMLLLLYPLVSLPIGLAYLARWAFESELAFYGGLLFAAALGAVIYWIAMESAVAAAGERKERMLDALAKSEAPMHLA